MNNFSVTDQKLAQKFEVFACSLANKAGGQIIESLSKEINVRYKDSSSKNINPRDPVSDIDQAVEKMLSEQIKKQYPDHTFLGEEFSDTFDDSKEFTWVIDPIDGTQNFVNGLPFYSCSIGLLKQGLPIAAAIWAIATHMGMPGVYHTHRGGKLKLDGQILDGLGRHNQGKKRGIVTTPINNRQSNSFEYRNLGSTALEGALVAAGVLQASKNPDPHIWDVAACILLAQSAECEVWTKGQKGWASFDRFNPEELSSWRQSTLIANPDVVESLRN
ncbi:MAG: inositol-1-monophosphatase [Chloroflexi bacterium]|nr:inositol-1-monophosphatase [Chloroflexota bacterium]|tara:strand:- start:26634 stop:27455 length:822 start_codon:yes stop_codon:yes gene_type:complete